MIDHRYKCIFIHTPQCAARNIVHEFYGSYWNETPKNPNVDFLSYGVTFSQNDYESYQTLYSDYYVFACVRNPWDRFINGWKFCESTKNLNFDTLLNNLPQFDNNFTIKHLKNSPWMYISQTQTNCLYTNGSLVPDFVMKYETLQTDFDTVCDTIGKPRSEISILSRYDNLNLNYKSFFVNQTQKDKFSSHFQQDITNFNYNFN